MAKKKPEAIVGPLTGRTWKLDKNTGKYQPDSALKFKGAPKVDFKTWTRQELIDHINICADQWGVPRVKGIEKCSDEALRKTVAKLFREGEKCGTHQM